VSEPSLKQQSEGTGWLLSGVVVTRTVLPLISQGRDCIDTASDAVMTVDLSGITESDSAAVALLIDWVRYAHRRQKQLVFTNMPGPMHDVVQVSGLEKILSIK
jgi:phospholipid transport system transporter-binding protein